MQNILISTECVADVPEELVEKYDIGIVYYTIKTDGGEFRDTDEITALNIMEYMMGGSKKALSIIPSVETYEAFFRKNLEKYDEIIHISISGGVSEAVENARTARTKLENGADRIHVVDSKHLSSGLGILVIKAAIMRDEGLCGSEIEEKIKAMIPAVSTSFLAYNADYLYYNDKVSKRVMDICRSLDLHPVLTMADGKLSLKGVYIGRYDRAVKKYIKKVTADKKNIQSDIGFITYAGCSHKMLEGILKEVRKRVDFGNIFEQQASASISCNCGPNTFGIIHIRK